jgi:hypothetical protein
MELISNKEFCKRLALLSFAWFAVGCGSYGIHFSVKLVNFNIFIITAIKELVVGVTIILLVPLYGRVSEITLSTSFISLRPAVDRHKHSKIQTFKTSNK